MSCGEKTVGIREGKSSEASFRIKFKGKQWKGTRHLARYFAIVCVARNRAEKLLHTLMKFFSVFFSQLLFKVVENEERKITETFVANIFSPLLFLLYRGYADEWY